MTPARLLLRSLTYFWRTNLAVTLGIITATAVIAGALIVGDSVRDSLRTMSLVRLGKIDHALTAQRFFREELGTDISTNVAPIDSGSIAPAIVMTAAVTHDVPQKSKADAPRTVRAGGIQLYAVDERLWEMTDHGGLSVPSGNDVVLNQRTAEQLGVSVGDEINLIVEIPATIPRDSLLGDRKDTVTELLMTVTGIAQDDVGLGRLGLNPSQQLPANAYVALKTMQRQLGLSAVRATRRNPIAKPARVNALFVNTSDDTEGDSSLLSSRFTEQLTEAAHQHLTLADLNLKTVRHKERGYFSLESEQMILESSVTEAGLAVAQELGWRTSPVLVYLVNRLGKPRSIPDPENPNQEILAEYAMYSVVAGIDFQAPNPFGPFEYIAGGPPETGTLPPVEPFPVVLNEWLADDLKGLGGDDVLIHVGDVIPVEYHVVGDRGDLPTEKKTFRVTGIIRLQGPADDPGFTPVVPGVTDVETYGDWREPFPLDHDAITKRDELYWQGNDSLGIPSRRATPKAFLPLSVAQSLWRSRYGNLTSIRMAPPEGMPLETAEQLFQKKLLEKLSPLQTGLVFQPVKQQGLKAADGTTDFSGLFVGFSFFLIVAAMLLVGLLFRLGIERRTKEYGLLCAVGWEPAKVRRQFLKEGLLLSITGGLIGLPAAIGYAGLMVYGLKTWWRAAIGTPFLFLSVTPRSLVIGLAIGLIVAWLAIVWALRQMRGFSSRELLAGVTEKILDAEGILQRGRTSVRIAITTLTLALLLLGASLAGMVPSTEAFSGFSWRVVAFFVVGISVLTGSLAALAWWLNTDRSLAVHGQGTIAVGRLGLRNAARHRGRSVLTASLIASATFVIVAVATGQRNPAVEQPVKTSGNGGFTLVAETSQPILYDLNSESGRQQLNLTAESKRDRQRLQAMQVMPFRMRSGEDASCLNLYQTRLPTILGVPQDVIQAMSSERRFAFADTPSDDPWNLLTQPLENGHVPILGDMNTLLYSLKKPIGESIEIPPEALVGSEVDHANMQVVGMFDGSIFQGVLLMSEENFLRLFPKVAGYRYFLIEIDPQEAASLSELLESRLDGFGFDAEPVADRLQDFLAVQNTYLSTFQTLGGLGLLLGSIGLGAVMLRNVLERRSELALMRAIGFPNTSISILVLSENAFLLLWGLLAGTLAALLAMTPHLNSTGADVPWVSLELMLLAVFAIGMLTALTAVREAVRTPIVATLRME